MGIATTNRSPADIQVAWTRLDRLYRGNPVDPTVAGARAAAEWTIGRTSVSPVSNDRTPAEGLKLQLEGHEAAMVEVGLLPGNVHYARGAAAWLFWWVGLRDLPGWLRRSPTP